MTARLVTSMSIVLLSLTQLAAAGKIAFNPLHSYPVGTNPTWVVAADFNNDGKRDLAVINEGDASVGDPGGVSILLGKGDGTFQAATNVAIGKNCTSAVAGDFNGDGNNDLALLRPGDASVNDDGDVTIFLGNGDGTFRQGQVLTPGKNPSFIVVADLNGDQRMDLVVITTGDKSVDVLLGNGDGSFQSPIAYAAQATPGRLAVVDIDLDGKKDLAVSGIPFGLSGYFLLGNGDGTFRSTVPTVGDIVAVGDFNGDGKPDLAEEGCTIISITPPKSSCNWYLHPGNGDGTFQAGVSIGQPVQVAGDFDGDGKLDLAGSLNGQIQILTGNGDGSFQPPITVNSNGTLTQVLDVNGDIAPDLVMIGQNSVGLMVNVGTDFSLSASALSPSTLVPGQSATSSLTLKLLSNFDNPVSLTCAVQPAQAGAPTCSLSSSSVTFDATGGASATLTIAAGSSAASLNSLQPFSKNSLLWLPVVGFAFLGTGLGVSPWRRRPFLMLPIGLVLFIGIVMETACGGGSNGGPKSTAYTVTITAASGATQHSTTVNLTVQ